MAAEHVALMGRRIAEAREAAGLTQAELAAKIPGKSDGTQVSKWERGIHRPSDDTLEHIAKVLDRPIAWFVTRPAQKNQATPEPFSNGARDIAGRLDHIEENQRKIINKLAEVLGLVADQPETIGNQVIRILREILREEREVDQLQQPPPPLPRPEGERPAA